MTKQNLELKAELRDPALARDIVRSIGGRFAELVRQVDRYYRLADGRLKRRETWRLDPSARAARQEAPAGSAIVEPVAAEEAADEVEFVHYFRVNSAAPRLSRYSIFTAEQARARYGPAPGPVWVTVRKTREVWLYHGVRVHLDDVDGLGAFLELEAPVTTPRPMSRCRALVAELRAALGPALGEPVTVSYSDLVASAPG